MEKRQNTIVLSVTRGILLFLIPLNILLSVYALFSWSFLRTQAMDNYHQYLQMVIQQADDELSNLSAWLQNLFYTSSRFQLLRSSKDNGANYLTAQEINQEVRTYLEMYPNEMAFFIHCSSQLHIPAVSTFQNTSNNIELSAYIRNIASVAQEKPMGDFFLIQLGKKWYLSMVLRQKDVYAGVIMDVDGLLATLDLSSADTTSYGFQSRDGVPVTLFEGDERDISISHTLENAPLSLVIFLPESAVLGSFTLLNALSVFLTLVALASVVSFIAYTRRQVAEPLKKLQETIRKIEAGYTEEKIDIAGEKTEVAQVYHAFNAFIDHIMKLKMESYEERLARQKTELQYLRLQLRPHFFLNAMKRLYALTQEGQIAAVQEYILCLSSHYRFLIYDTTNTISLQEEMRHVENYIQLQQIGYHLEISCQITMEVNPSLIQVPPLVIQSFVENSIKHAVRPGSSLHLEICADLIDGEEGKYLNIRCTDNGPGFSKETLEEINLGDEEFSKKHVGFNNLKHRLALIYQKESFIYVHNLPSGGAAVEVMIPLEEQKKKQEQSGRK